MLQLRQLDFEFALEAARAAREDIQDETTAVEHAHAAQAFEIALLARRQRVIEQNQFGILGARGIGNLLRLAAAHVIT